MKSETIVSIEILTTCFLLNLLYGGASRLASMFFVASIHRYEANRTQASLPYVLAYTVRNLSGVFHGSLEHMFGMKRLVLFGNVIAVISLVGCFFAEDILIVTILWGLVFGFCFGLGTQYLPTLLNAHFTTNRNKSNGFAYAGASIGAIFLPPIFEECLELYGLSGSFLILSAIMAHTIPLSFLLKSSEENEIKSIICIRKEKEMTSLSIEAKENNQSIPLCLKQNKNLTGDKLYDKVIDMDENKQESMYFSLNKANHNINMKETDVKRQKTNNIVKSMSALSSNLQNYKIFLEPAFVLILIITGGNILIITTMWTIILDFVRDKGIEAHLEIYFLAVMPLADAVGRLGSGFILDKNYLPTEVMTLLCFIFTGLTLLALQLIYNYLVLLFFEFFFAVFYSSLLILQISLVHEFIQSEKRTMAMVCRTMLFAPLGFTISPMIGYFRGYLGYYDGVLYILIATSFFCGIISYFIPHLAKRRQINTSDNVS